MNRRSFTRMLGLGVAAAVPGAVYVATGEGKVSRVTPVSYSTIHGVPEFMPGLVVGSEDEIRESLEGQERGPIMLMFWQDSRPYMAGVTSVVFPSGHRWRVIVTGGNMIVRDRVSAVIDNDPEDKARYDVSWSVT